MAKKEKNPDGCGVKKRTWSSPLHSLRTALISAVDDRIPAKQALQDGFLLENYAR